ncbi:unnamed protein product [Trichobilharzia szidati]|nr:unnamed protein product [Trichobilharzia szidati]
MCYFRKTGQEEKISQFLKSSLEKTPNREDLLVCLFLHQVQGGDFSAQQATARLLLQKYPSTGYNYWLIMSTIMQAESDPVMGQRMYLPLAEKMLIREAEGGKMSRHSEFQVLIDLLGRLHKHDAAYKLLNRKDITENMDKEDYSCDYFYTRLSLAAHLDIWEDLYELVKARVKVNPNDWTPWKKLIEVSLGDKERMEAVMSLVNTTVTDHRCVRAPQLARLDLYVNMLKLGLNSGFDHNPLTYMLDYFNTFCHKPICSLDLAYLVRVVLPNQDDQQKYISTLLETVEANLDFTNKEDKSVYRHLCAYQIARANNHQASSQTLLRPYFGYAPDRSELLVKKLKDIAIKDEVNFLDLYPVDGFLLLALSSLLEASSVPVDNYSFSFGAGLLAIYWIHVIGLEYTNVNHHLRMKLCSLYSSDYLNCTELLLPHLDKLQIKQLLFLSLGHLFIKPSPSLTVCTDILPSQSQNDDNSNSLHSLYQRIMTLSSSMVNEAEECLVAAYRKHAYTKIREFTQFVNQLKNADTFLTVQTELLHWQLIISQSDFDTLLEHIGPAQTGILNISKRLKTIVDCRDFSVTPNFDPCEQQENVQLSFDHLISWINLRFTTLNVILDSTSLVMSIVRVVHSLISDNDKETSENVLSSEAVKNVNTLLSTLNNLASRIKKPSEEKMKNFKTLSWNVMTRRDQILKTFPDLPDITCTSLYYYGPYRSILSIGLEIMLGLLRLVSDGPCAFPRKSIDYLFNSLNECFSSVKCIPKDMDIPQIYPSVDTTSFPFAHNGVHTTNETSGDKDCVHLGGILLILTMLYESISLGSLLISMIRSALRPRSHYHHQASKRQKRKVKKDKSINEDSVHSPIFNSLDHLGACLHNTVIKFIAVTNHLAEASDSWSSWCRSDLSKEFHSMALNACTYVLSEDFLEQYPVLKPSVSAFEEISTTYEKSFTRITAGFRVKTSCLQSIASELAIYESLNHEIESEHVQDSS